MTTSRFAAAAALLVPALLLGGTASAAPVSPDAGVSKPQPTERITPVGPGKNMGPTTVDPLAEGQGIAPATPLTMPKTMGTTGVTTTTNVWPFAFKTSGTTMRLPAGQYQPWHNSITGKDDPAPHDADGVRKFLIGTTLYDHAVGQLQWGLVNLNTFRTNKDPFFLDRALANADRLVTTKTVAEGAYYFGYPFDFSSPGHHLYMKAPWFSGMAQGEALSLFSQLSTTPELTDAQRTHYRQVADATYLSFFRGPNKQPWTVHRDASGYLWLEEYPQSPESASDFTLNGHMFATLGLWDYWQVSKLAQARTLFDGAVTTILRYAPVLRTINWISRYCIPHVVRAARYHHIHQRLALELSWLSGDQTLASISDSFRNDYPWDHVEGKVQFYAGTHYGYKFSSTGGITATRTLVLNASSQAPTTRRIRIQGRGMYYLITAGSLSGYYVPEAIGRSFLRGQILKVEYNPARGATMKAGTYIGRTFNTSNGVTVTSKTATLAATTSATVTFRSVVNGTSYVQFATGTFAGYWVPASQVALAM